MEVDPRSLLPRHRSDVEHVKALVDLGYPAIAPVLRDIAEWLQDGNWPISRPIGRFLASIGEPVLPTIREVLTGDDDVWKYWCIDLVMREMVPQIGEQLRPELERIAYYPTPGERMEEVDVEARAALKQFEQGCSS
ncbi:MAG: DUF5071 domain-containing protein [Anaerolineae bacterium]|nr:DUF5071 domain-containing protein [Anaerolineae bacterium]